MILALQSSTSVSSDWWASLKHGGLLIAPSKLSEFFVAESLPALPRWIEDRLRRDVTRLQNGESDHLSTFLDTVLEEVLGLTGDWQKGSQVDRLWSYPAITREVIRPRRVWQSPQGDVLPVFVADGQDGGKVVRLGIGRGKRSVTRVVEWLRKANQKVALLTNGYQWRLIHAGADYDAWCEWDITFWFEEGQPGLQVTALRLLLGVQALQAQQASGLNPLIAAIDASRQGQGEISEVLGERVRQAVELLIQESSESLTALVAPHPPSPLLPLGEKGEQESGSAPLSRSGRGVGGEGGSEAESSRSDHETSTSELKTSGSELGTSGLELETSTSELKPSSLELETPGSELGRSSLELGASSLELETSRSELGRSRSEVKLLGSEPESLPERLRQRPTSQPEPSPRLLDGMIRSADGRSAISIAEVEDVALPLYQGIMIHQFDFAPKRWISGTGVRAMWEEIPWKSKLISPQFLMSSKDVYSREKMIRGLKPSIRRVARNSDTRTAICSLVADMPCGDKASIFAPETFISTLVLPAYVNSYAFDWLARIRVGGTQFDYHIAAEMPTPLCSNSAISKILAAIVLRLNGASSLFADSWLKLKAKASDSNQILNKHWKQLWAIAPYERLRLRAILDAVVAHLYGLDTDDFAWILRDCDHPIARVNDKAIARTFDPKGFWRVDKDKPPELRHTVLSQVAFQDLKAILFQRGSANGLEDFLNLNNGEGWMLPETLRLADYGLGHDDRAKEHQPVASRVGAETAKLWESSIGSRQSSIESPRLTTYDSQPHDLTTPHSLPIPIPPLATRRHPRGILGRVRTPRRKLKKTVGKSEIGNRESGLSTSLCQ